MNERVDDVRRKLDVDVCSLYLAHPDRQRASAVPVPGILTFPSPGTGDVTI